MSAAPVDTLEQMRQLLCQLQNELRERIASARAAAAAGELAGVAARTSADTIYVVDKVSEHVIAEWFGRHWPAQWPVEIVMEGIEDDQPLTFPTGTPLGSCDWVCIIDPIDGTRNLMYDKRSAWALAGIAPRRPAPTLADIAVAAMTELPTSRQWRCDQLSAVRGRGLTATTIDLIRGGSAAFIPQPTRADDCRHGFSAISRFFPAGLELLGRVEERLWNRLYPEARDGSPLVFNDQYISTGGQLYELIIGHDRFLADLRPLVFAHMGLSASLACHPYDLAALLVATEAGIVVEDPLSGEELRAPLDTTTPVSWCAYANAQIAAHVRPALRDSIRDVLQSTGASCRC